MLACPTPAASTPKGRADRPARQQGGADHDRGQCELAGNLTDDPRARPALGDRYTGPGHQERQRLDWVRAPCELRLAVVLCTPSRAVESLEKDREVNAFSLQRFSSPAGVGCEPAGRSITCADTDAVARRKILGRTRALVCACEGPLGKSDLHDQGLLAAQTARIQENSTATGDLGVGPRIPVVGGIEQIPWERVERSFDRGIDAAATAGRRRYVIVLKAPGDCEPGLPRRRRWAMDHRRAKRIAIRESAHAKQTPRKQRRPGA